MNDASCEDVALVDLADRLLAKGVTINGDIVLSVAGVDLVYLSLRALIASVETAMDLGVAQEGLLR
ncbi:MAG TPA: gas vesicle protein [Acidimicrobiales bacterium]|nr:gas vesicle protein [Acidimicrobiales bacterium]